MPGIGIGIGVTKSITSTPPVVPLNALLDDSGLPLLNDDGSYILND
jgi:hypothetical protein